MGNRRFYRATLGLLVIGIVVRVLPFFTNQFYFTMDQGRDAVYVREILAGGKLPLVGPETSVAGVYHGVLWYYFIAIGYALFAGHPFGAVFMLILLNTTTLAALMLYIRRNVSATWALITGATIQVFWGFHEVSRYAYNPFPLASLTIIALILVSRVTIKAQHWYLWAAVPVGFTFHAHIVAAVPVALWYTTAGIYLWFSKRINGGFVILGICMAFLFLTPHILYEAIHGFSQVQSVWEEMFSPGGTLVARNTYFTKELAALIGTSIVPQSQTLGFVFLGGVVVAVVFQSIMKKAPTHPLGDMKVFVVLALLLLVTTWLWYTVTLTWKPWQTVYVPPILVIILCYGIYHLPRRVAVVAIAVLVLLHAQYFWYRQRTDPADDASYLSNELKAIDWVYQNADSRGFAVYSYLPSVLDYPYQYLIWWHGLKRYGYVPCEYASFPGSPKLFVPGSVKYEAKVNQCDGTRFLLIEPDANETVRNQWITEVRSGTNIVMEGMAGAIRLEKRKTILQ